MKTLHFLTSAVLLVLAGGITLAENWPQFRGASGQGVSAEKHLPLKWSVTENVTWKTELPGESWSSPVVWVERVFVTTATDGGVATCMKADTSELMWQERVGGSFSATPLAAEGRICFLGDNGETTVIEAGPEFKALAKNPLGEKVQASMAVSQGQLFIRTETNLFCIANVSSAAAVHSTSPGLVAHWTFDEASGAQAIDSSDGKHDGKLLGALRTAGKVGGAIAGEPVLDGLFLKTLVAFCAKFHGVNFNRFHISRTTHFSVQLIEATPLLDNACLPGPSLQRRPCLARAT